MRRRARPRPSTSRRNVAARRRTACPRRAPNQRPGSPRQRGEAGEQPGRRAALWRVLADERHRPAGRHLLARPRPPRPRRPRPRSACSSRVWPAYSTPALSTPPIRAAVPPARITAAYAVAGSIPAVFRMARNVTGWTRGARCCRPAGLRARARRQPVPARGADPRRHRPRRLSRGVRSRLRRGRLRRQRVRRVPRRAVRHRGRAGGEGTRHDRGGRPVRDQRRPRTARSTPWSPAVRRRRSTARSTSTTRSATGSPTGSAPGEPAMPVTRDRRAHRRPDDLLRPALPRAVAALSSTPAPRSSSSRPPGWPAPRKVDHWRTLLRARAIENTVYVVAAAQPAPRYTGHSMVVDPLGDVLAEAGDGDEMITRRPGPRRSSTRPGGPTPRWRIVDCNLLGRVLARSTPTCCAEAVVGCGRVGSGIAGLRYSGLPVVLWALDRARRAGRDRAGHGRADGRQTQLSRSGAVAIASAYSWALAARTGGRPVIFGGVALVLGVGVIAARPRPAHHRRRGDDLRRSARCSP